MNIRKNIDYSEMYEALDILIAQQLPQMELYCEIGKAICRRTEKGAAVMASEYLNKRYPDVKGFSPRNLRRMRDFYRTYESHPTLVCQANLEDIIPIFIRIKTKRGGNHEHSKKC